MRPARPLLAALLVVLLVVLLNVPACAAYRSPPPPSPDIVTAIEAQAAAEVTKEGVAIVRSRFFRSVVTYLPNRVMDLFDTVRFGVNVGPGLGAQVKLTAPLQVTAMSRATVGVGLQSLRHLPVTGGRETTMQGPIAGPGADDALDWHRSPTDLRVELHPLVAGAHVAVDPVELLDFVLGFVGTDLRGDDLL
jgi:hypothetical protein